MKSTMKTPQKNIDVIQALADAGLGRLHREYSGRGMCGSTCMGLSTQSPQACIDAAARKGVRGARTDALGKGSIVYWPSVCAETASA